MIIKFENRCRNKITFSWETLRPMECFVFAGEDPEDPENWRIRIADSSCLRQYINSHGKWDTFSKDDQVIPIRNVKLVREAE